jgi:histidine triad (HIT) family protein
LHDANCIFCRIIQGQIPCYKLYEDDRVLAFLDVGPLSRGHSLVIPKAHAVTLDQLSDEDAMACAKVLPRLSRALIKATGAPGWNVLQNNGPVAGQAVGHVHFHLIPRQDGDGLGYRWPAGKLDAADAKALVEKITQAL